MNTLDEYLNTSPEKRPAMVAANRPPLAHTHRKPGRVSSADVLASRRRLAEYTPTHRGEQRPILTELATVNARLAANGKD